MNEAFEKIIELLTDAGACDASCEYDCGWDNAIDEAISIVQEVAEEYFNEYVPFDNIIDLVESYIEDAKSEGDYHYIRPFELVIQGVRELAKGYNDDWIPCSERLPDKNKIVLITYHGFIDDFYKVVTAYIREDDEWKIEFGGVCNHSNVIAWQPLPQPYKERD